MLASLTLLLVFQLIGETVVQWLRLPVPGPVLGMLLLFAALVLRGEVPVALRDTANGLLQHLSLLFVPAGVGVMTHLALLATAWLPISVAILLSTAVTLLVTAFVMRAAARQR
ncbi:CidA/LrgA family protein [Methyloversatilis sp.]|uniref:CidA/LrgA family protein n=1 Tax=Methyloversatilis sp. TaxID=2569862 RepID=UPI00273343C8|nr:CidA/LrgA family protein [Methyloversatilis sp.]MDP2867368.1 CidA/LrgA family protein [Methyloversatilis sp.]MDP3454432.1 CidA/LrgA family protein [Methyloversatilis sp.]MDP3577582.1 CidA/LrgA family protein [Methyloversatilis sp.]